MGVNLEAIRKKLQQMQQSSGGGTRISDYLWKPPVGKTQVRILPYAHNKDTPFIELFFHYEIGKRTMISPVSFGRPDPIQEFADKLQKTGDKDDWKMGRKISPKMRVFAPVLVRGAESEGVKFWSFGKQIYTELLSVISDPDYGDISDLTSGRDVTVEHIAPEKEGAFPTYSVRVKPGVTPATEDKELAKTIVSDQTNLAELYTENTYDEMKDALAAWLNPNGEASDGTAAPAAAPSKATTASTSGDIDSAFEELFDDKK